MRIKQSALTVQEKETGLLSKKVQEVFARQVYEMVPRYHIVNIFCTPGPVLSALCV